MIYESQKFVNSFCFDDYELGCFQTLNGVQWIAQKGQDEAVHVHTEVGQSETWLPLDRLIFFIFQRYSLHILPSASHHLHNIYQSWWVINTLNARNNHPNHLSTCPDSKKSSTSPRISPWHSLPPPLWWITPFPPPAPDHQLRNRLSPSRSLVLGATVEMKRVIAVSARWCDCHGVWLIWMVGYGTLLWVYVVAGWRLIMGSRFGLDGLPGMEYSILLLSRGLAMLWPVLLQCLSGCVLQGVLPQCRCQMGTCGDSI